MTTQHEQAKTRIGFIGMGHMGSHMVPRLLNAGYPMTLYDRTKEKAQQVAQQKAGLGKEQLLDVLGQTAVIAPNVKGKLENVKREEYPTNFALSLMLLHYRQRRGDCSCDIIMAR